jgi:superfamily I DNA/RNA helicase
MSKVIPVITHHNERAFRKALLRLRNSGGSSQRAAETAARIIGNLSFGVEELNKLTHNGENRISNCFKYNISNDGHRLVTVKTQGCVYLLFVGTHEEADTWIDRNRGLTITVNKKSKQMDVTFVNHVGDRAIPPIDYEKLRDANPPYWKRMNGFDPDEFVKQRSLARLVKKVDDDTSDDEIVELCEDLHGLDEEVGALVFDVVTMVRESNVAGAEARIATFKKEALPVQDDPELEEAALADPINSDKALNLTGLSPKELERLLSPEQFHEWMLFLHPEQKRIAVADYEKPTILTGVSGSGKTCVLVHRARHLAQKYPGEKIALLTLNRSLSRLLDNLVTELCSEEERKQIDVLAFYDYFGKLALKFGPANELENLRALAKSHPEREHIVKVIDQVDHRNYVRERDPVSGEDLDETWDLFYDQPYVRTLCTYFNERILTYDTWVDVENYLREEFSLIRSAVVTSDRESSYVNLERNGRAIPLRKQDRRHVLDLLLLYEETMLHGGLLDELSLTLMLVPHLQALKDLPAELGYRCFLIDEYQDLSTRDLVLFRRLMKPKENALFLAGDTVQRVLVKSLDLGRVGLGVQDSHREKITKNYRNSRQILQAASNLSRVFGAQAIELAEDVEILDPELAVRETTWPHAIQTTAEDEIATAWDYARECVSGGGAVPWSICLVTTCPQQMPVQTIIDGCPEDFPVKVEPLTGNYQKHQDTMTVATMSDIKGFEFSMILIVGCGVKHLPMPGRTKAEWWRDALRLYVAMTRARDEVTLIYSEAPSPFLECMADDLWWVTVEEEGPDQVEHELEQRDHTHQPSEESIPTYSTSEEDHIVETKQKESSAPLPHPKRRRTRTVSREKLRRFTTLPITETDKCRHCGKVAIPGSDTCFACSDG